MTHASVPPEARAQLGISDTLIRFSVGIEDPADLIAAIEHAVGRPVPNVLPLTPEKLLATVEAAR